MKQIPPTPDKRKKRFSAILVSSAILGAIGLGIVYKIRQAQKMEEVGREMGREKGREKGRKTERMSEKKWPFCDTDEICKANAYLDQDGIPKDMCIQGICRAAQNCEISILASELQERTKECTNLEHELGRNPDPEQQRHVNAMKKSIEIIRVILINKRKEKPFIKKWRRR